MAERNKSDMSKDDTPPPLLLMPASQGLTLEPVGGNPLFMPLAQTEAALFAPEEEGEADSFVGQTPPSQSPVSTYFQPAAQQGVQADPFAQMIQPVFGGTPQRTSAAPTSSGTPSAVPAAQTASSASASPYSLRFSGESPYRNMPPPADRHAPVAYPDSSLFTVPVMQPTGVEDTNVSSGVNMAPPNLPPVSGFQPRPQGPAGVSSHPVHVGVNPGGHYIPVQKHWFYCKNIELHQLWKPFSMADSLKLEDAWKSGYQDNVIVSTDGGRYDVDVIEHKRTAVFWTEVDSEVRRCSWFYRLEGDNRYVPYHEQFAEKLEVEYKNALMNNDWHKRLEFPGGETIVMHSPAVLLHFRPSSQPDEYGTTQSEQRPRVVKRGVDEFDSIVEGEPSKVDHLIFVVHGIGPTCDLRFRNIVECVDDFRSISMQMIDAHFKPYQEEGRIGRVEFLPVCWHSALHSDATGVDRKLKSITLSSIGKLRHFTNDTLLDILFYSSPVYSQNIADTVSSEMNRLYNLFCSRNPEFRGKVSVSGHSLGSLILFDMLAHQKVHNMQGGSAEAHVNESTADEIVQSLQDHHISQLEVEDNQESGETATVTLSMEQMFQQLGLQDYMETFQKEKMDMETLIMCDDADLKEMGLPLGPRKKIQSFLKEHKSQQFKNKESEKRRQEQEFERKVKEEAQRMIQQQQQQEQLHLQSGHAGTIHPLLRDSSQTQVSFLFGLGGTGLPLVKYPQLEFEPCNFFALGSPIAMFLTVRGVSSLGEQFKFPTCPGFFNIFHPFDPVAYRFEPLIASVCPPKPVLMPHHKGRKRLHLELRDSLGRVGADLKQKIVDSLKSTWKTINDFALAHRTTPQEVDEQVESVISEMAKEEDDGLDTASIASSAMEEEYLIGTLNQGRRIDFVLQERPIESFNDYLFALSSHGCYWESEDTVLMILKEIYSLEGVAPIKPGQSQAMNPQMHRTTVQPVFSSNTPPPVGILSTDPMPGPAAVNTRSMPISTCTPGQTGPSAHFGPPPLAGFVKSPSKNS